MSLSKLITVLADYRAMLCTQLRADNATCCNSCGQTTCCVCSLEALPELFAVKFGDDCLELPARLALREVTHVVVGWGHLHEPLRCNSYNIAAYVD